MKVKNENEYASYFSGIAKRFKFFYQFLGAEKYIQDRKYRKELEQEEQDSGIGYTFYENYELMDLLGLEKKIKEKLKIPENSIIKFESIKCSKKCRHKTHRYFYTYFWDPLIKKLRKNTLENTYRSLLI